MNGFQRKVFYRTAIGVAVSLFLIALLLTQVNWEQLRETLFRARWRGVGIAFVLYCAVNYLRTLRFRLISIPLPQLTLFSVVSVHNFLLRVLPARLGEVGYAYLMKRCGAGGLTQNLIGLLLIRILDATMVLVIFGITLPFSRGLAIRNPSHLALLAVSVALLGVVLVIYFHRLLAAGRALLRWMTRLLGIRDRPSIAKFEQQIGLAIDEQRSLPKMVLASMVFLTTVLWTTIFSMLYQLVSAFGFEISLPLTILGATGGVVSGFLPISGIGNFGALEAGYAIGFALVGLDPSDAVAASFACSASTFIFAALLSLLGWILISAHTRDRQVDGEG